MSRSELFENILRMVSEETEIPSSQIVSRRKDSETVDARYLLVHFLSDTGFSPSYIAEKIGVTERTVTNIKTNFEIRCSVQKLLRMNCENLTKRIRNN